MNYVVVTQEWMAARNIMPLPTMRKSKDGTKYLAHEDFFNAFKTKNADDEEALEGLTLYPHNSTELTELLASDEWANDERTSAESADYVQVAAVQNLMTAAKANIQNYSMTDNEALKAKDMYPEWEPGIDVKEGEKYNSEGKLYKCKSSHKTQSDWKPGSGAFSLWEEVSRHDGTQEDPIPYNEEHDPLFAGMELEQGKYYSQDGVTYLCTRSTGQAVYNNLSELVGIYVQTVD